MNNKLFGFLSVYGLLIAGAILLAVFLCEREARRRGLQQDTGIDMALWAVPPAVVCARIYYVAFQWELYAHEPLAILRLWEGGLAIYGAVIGGALGLFFLSRKRSLAYLTLLDIAAPVVLLGQGIGRWGNFFNGEAYGTLITNPAWQFFPAGVLINGTWHMATFFYESCWNLLGFALLQRFRLRARQPGSVFYAYLLWYSAGRMFIEGLRTDSLMLGSIRISQLLSAVLFLCSLVMLLHARKRTPPESSSITRGS